jgi:transcriptional regulator with XRE-family HTH domain
MPDRSIAARSRSGNPLALAAMTRNMTGFRHPVKNLLFSPTGYRYMSGFVRMTGEMTGQNGDKPLNERIRAARLAAGMSQKTLAQKLGTAERRVIAWEKGENAPGPRYAKMLAEATGQESGAFTTSRGATRVSIERRLRTVEQRVEDVAARLEALAEEN